MYSDLHYDLNSLTKIEVIFALFDFESTEHFQKLKLCKKAEIVEKKGNEKEKTERQKNERKREKRRQRARPQKRVQEIK